MSIRRLELLTDLYELTMAQAYHQHGKAGPATFSLFVRKLPPDRSYLVAAGLADVLRYLNDLQFSSESIDYLASTEIFSRDFLEYLRTVRFTGDVWAVPEGRLVFANEPIIEVTAPVIEAQLVETYLINQVNLQTMLATKAARCVTAARGRGLVDFGLRRTHGTDAGMKSARASYMAGFAATSNVLAGKEFGIPVSGTMAHSFVTAFEHEIDAFQAFAESFPDRCVLLIDTYDTVDGARKAVQVAREMESRGHRLQGVRLDSGDMLALSKEVRSILDGAGLSYVEIFASGGLDEYEIDELLAAGAPIDAFGVGTKLGVSGDAPWLDAAYKMVSYEDRPVLKLSTGKPSLPGPKQVYRCDDAEGRFERDVIATREETIPDSEPLLEKVMENGRPLQASPSLEDLRSRFTAEFGRLPERYKVWRDGSIYPVELSEGLRRAYEAAEAQAKAGSRKELGES